MPSLLMHGYNLFASIVFKYDFRLIILMQYLKNFLLQLIMQHFISLIIFLHYQIYYNISRFFIICTLIFNIRFLSYPTTLQLPIRQVKVF